jgi:hypothetical protein
VHLAQQLPGGGTLSFTGYAGQDVLDASLASFGDSTKAGGGRLLFDWGNAVAGLAYTQPLPGMPGADSARFMQRLSYTRFGTTLDVGSGSLTFKNGIGESRAWGELQAWRGRHEALVGYEWSAYQVRYDVNAAQAGTSLYKLAQNPSAAAIYLDDTFRASKSWLMRGGLRGETVTGTQWAGLSPRLSIKWFAAPELAFTLAGGSTAQWTPALRNEQAPVRVFDFWLTSDQYIPVARAHQGIAGVERWFDDARFVRVEGYYKYYDRLPASNLFNDPNVPGDEFIITTGKSYGVDVLVRQLESRKLSGWIAYSFAISSRTGPQGTFAPVQDRRHNLNIVGSYKPSAGHWSYGFRLGVGTGVPFTDVVGQIVRRRYDPLTNTWETGTVDRQREPVGGARNAARFPLFQRLDLSATRTSTRWGLTWAPYISVINAYNAKNVFTYVFDYTDNPPTRSAFSQFPLIPTFGVSVSW